MFRIERNFMASTYLLSFQIMSHGALKSPIASTSPRKYIANWMFILWLTTRLLGKHVPALDSRTSSHSALAAPLPLDYFANWIFSLCLTARHHSQHVYAPDFSDLEPRCFKSLSSSLDI